MRKLLIACVLIATPVAGAFGQTLSKVERDAVNELFAISGVNNLAGQIAEASFIQTIELLEKRDNKRIPPTAKRIMKEEFGAVISEHMGGMMDAMAPIYLKHFTVAEIREIAAFYKTPTGRKATTLMPKMVNEGMAIAQQWAVKVIPIAQQRMLQRLKQSGYNVK